MTSNSCRELQAAWPRCATARSDMIAHCLTQIMGEIVQIVRAANGLPPLP